MPSPPQQFQQYLTRIARALWSRILALEILRWGFYGCLGAIVLILLNRWLNIISNGAFLFYLIPPGAGVLAGGLAGLLKKPSLQQSALFLDTVLKLNNRLVTTLEYLKRPSDSNFTGLLVNDSVRHLEGVRLSLAYKYFNRNYVLRLVITVLVIGILIIIPVTRSPEALAKARTAELIKEEAVKIKNTAADIKKSPSLDAVTQSIVREMEQLADRLNESEADATAIQKRIEQLSVRTALELERITDASKMIEEIYLVLGQSIDVSKTPEILRNENTRKQFLQELEDKIRKGEITISALAPLKALLKKSRDDVNLNQVVNKALQSLETPETFSAEPPGVVSIAEPLEGFFRIMAGKQQDILERISGRLASLKSGLGLPPGRPESVPEWPDNRDVFNWGDGIYPVHPAEKGPDVFLAQPTDLNTPRAVLAEQIIKNRETALTKPYWPPEYDEVVKKYFSR